ncbi:MAG TPA: ABC transporter ATP-binding protein [Candidatus Moranbacteria bacterium]|nr:ABC transporter ATP-binding protein [Candidatus Moranbacteria bacterium]
MSEIKEEKKFDFRSFWVKIWKLLEPSHRQIINLLILLFFGEIIVLTGPYILKIIIDKIANFNPVQIGVIFVLIILMFLINQIASILDYFSDKKILAILADAIFYLSNNAHKKMVFLSLGYHEKENTGNKIVKISRGIDKIDNLFGNFFWEVAPTIFQVILTVALLFWVNWIFGLITIIFVPAFVFLTLKVNKIVYPFRRTRFNCQEEAAGIMAQSIININTVKSFVQEVREYNKFFKATKDVKDNISKEFKYVLRYNLARNFIIDLGRGLVLFFGIYLMFHGSITIGSLIFVYTISEKALLSLFRISRLYDRIMESSEAVERLYDLSLEKSEIKNSKNGIKPKNVEGKIEFNKVSFVYQESAIKALDGVSFSISPDSVTALVGPSGGGKTTVARMIYRHYDPISGEILIDGKNVKDYDIYAFRKFVAIVPQEVEVFNSTVRENISYAKSNASFSEIKAAAKIANAEEFINQLREGYDTMVGERGIKLSGGQRQRLGIARAILANPRILIFDEATSSLDSYSEKLIQEAMEKIRKNRTVIIIAHRLSTIKKADKIIVLENGKVAEEGSHTELSQMKGGLYQKLINLQRMGDVE